jgi:hypothetical protein
MLVVLLLLPLSLAMDDGKFDHGGGGRGGGGPAAVAAAPLQLTMIGGKSSWQKER